jgi:hypothetical protein
LNNVFVRRVLMMIVEVLKWDEYGSVHVRFLIYKSLNYTKKNKEKRKNYIIKSHQEQTQKDLFK